MSDGTAPRPFPPVEDVIAALGLGEAPLVDQVMAISIAGSAYCDEDKALLWSMHAASGRLRQR